MLCLVWFLLEIPGSDPFFSQAAQQGTMSTSRDHHEILATPANVSGLWFLLNNYQTATTSEAVVQNLMAEDSQD